MKTNRTFQWIATLGLLTAVGCGQNGMQEAVSTDESTGPEIQVGKDVGARAVLPGGQQAGGNFAPIPVGQLLQSTQVPGGCATVFTFRSTDDLPELCSRKPIFANRTDVLMYAFRECHIKSITTGGAAYGNFPNQIIRAAHDAVRGNCP